MTALPGVAIDEKVIVSSTGALELVRVPEKLLIVGGFCTLVLGMISLTLGRALRPLEALSQALQQVGGGDYAAHVPEKGPQELADIYRKLAIHSRAELARLVTRDGTAQLTAPD